ncbi:MAG: T9SS type A sorting domain-containing protein, partial [Candidatus Cloacimonas sp.]|nr:T9SS type A sorting domain-containing protein [Candidatus Cloacimonas sp.]
TFGATILGSIASTINNMEISDYSTGMYIEGDSTATRISASTTLGNVRIRNTSSSVRSATYGLKLVNLGSVQAIGDTIEGYTNGFELLSNNQTRTTTTATLGNVRIRNTSSSVRSETLGVKLQGNILATIDGLDVEDYSTGIYYEGDGMPFGRTTPTLGNVRIRNTSSSVREPSKGIVLKNLAGISLTKSSIYPNLTEMHRSNVVGIGISAEAVVNANIQQNTVWGFSNGLSLTDSPAAIFSNNVLWSNAGELTDPILLVNSSPIISSNDISYAAGVYPGAGNLDKDPLFVNPEEGNFYLKPRSPLRDTNIGALPFDFDVLAGWHSYTMHAGWNLMGVPYMTKPNQNPAANTPVAIFADDLNPFYVAPNYTSIVQMNNNTVNTSLQDALGHIVFNYTGSYNTPARIGAGVGYWVRNPYNYSTSIDVYGLMDDGSYNLGVPGADGSNNGWHLLANPYDRPIKWADGSMEAIGQITPYAQVYDYVSNRFRPMPSDDLTEIPPWSGFFIKAHAATDTLYINYPAASRQIPDNATSQTDISASGDAKPVWELALQAAAANSSDTVTLGIAKNARDAYDPMDVPKLPDAPFLMNGIIKLSVLNNDWSEQAGDYTRDIRNNESGSWSWNLQLNAEALLVDGRLCESLVLGLNAASRLPSGYRFSLTNLQSGQCIDLSSETMLLRLNIDAQNSPEGSMPWLIPLKLEAYNQNGAISAEQEIISTSNYPNPFNPETTISYNLGKNSPVSLKIYNLKGQLVTSLVNASQNSGIHNVTWNGKDSENRSVASGFYFYRLSAGSSTVTRKILMMK